MIVTDPHRSTDLNIKWKVNVWNYWFASGTMRSFPVVCAVIKVRTEIYFDM